MHNEAINHLKHHKNEVAYEKNILENKGDESISGIDEILANQEQQKLLTECLRGLPIEYREPLTLFFLEEKSYDEISDILRLPLGTVGTRISRGKIKLKGVFLQKGGIYHVKK